MRVRSRGAREKAAPLRLARASRSSVIFLEQAPPRFPLPLPLPPLGRPAHLVPFALNKHRLTWIDIVCCSISLSSPPSRLDIPSRLVWTRNYANEVLFMERRQRLAERRRKCRVSFVFRALNDAWLFFLFRTIQLDASRAHSRLNHPQRVIGGDPVPFRAISNLPNDESPDVP